MAGEVADASARIMKLCGQKVPKQWSEIFSEDEPPFKIGEGTYAEVLGTVGLSGEVSAHKIIPIDGHKEVNKERQQTSAELESEVAVTLALSSLSADDSNYMTPNFIACSGISICQGPYPDALLDEWDSWDTENTSESQRPDFFDDDQLFIVFHFQNGGEVRTTPAYARSLSDLYFMCISSVVLMQHMCDHL
jgi:serine/threonine-protein kinase haspin